MPIDRVPGPSSLEPQQQPHRGLTAQARIQRPAPMYLGHSAVSRQVQAQIQAAVDRSSAVLVSGAPGTGKRTVAEILHHFSGGELPSLEVLRLSKASESIKRHGRVTDFAYLCPIEAMSLEQQARLPNEVGLARVIMATRLDPASAQGQARLSRQLLRWCSIHIQLPSLRERVEDLEGLALKILGETPARRAIGGISDCALDCLQAYHWPGNVTELEAVLGRAVEVGSSEQIELCDLPPQLRLRDVDTIKGESPDEQFSLAHAERSAVQRAMRFARGNKRKAARLLGIGKTTLYRKLRE